MIRVKRLYSAVLDFIPREEIANFESFLMRREPQIWKALTSDVSESTKPSEQSFKSLKWSIKGENLDTLQLLLDSRSHSHEDVCVMAAYKGKESIVDMCHSYGVKMTNEIFSSACTGGNLELAKKIEKALVNTENYDDKATYQGIDYCTALYGAIAKSRKLIIDWLTVKSICPNYQTIGKILPSVQSKEVVDLVVSATPEINREEVMVELNKLKVAPIMENFMTSLAYGYWNIAKEILELKDFVKTVKTSTRNLKRDIVDLLLIRDNVQLLDIFVSMLDENETKTLVDELCIDSQSKDSLAILMKLSPDADKSKLIRASIKVGDFETAETLDYKSNVQSTFEGAVLGNHSWLVREICDREDLRMQISERVAKKLLNHAKAIGNTSAVKIISLYV